MIPKIINEQVASGKILLLDVREDFEWDDGHISGAKHIALDTIDSDTTKELPKNIPIYTYCRSGRRAEEAKYKLNKLGFNNVENLGGIISWLDNGGELVK